MGPTVCPETSWLNSNICCATFQKSEKLRDSLLYNVQSYKKGRDSSVGIANKLRAGRSGVLIQLGRYSFFPKRPAKRHIQWGLVVKRPERDSDHSSPPSAVVKNKWMCAYSCLGQGQLFYSAASFGLSLNQLHNQRYIGDLIRASVCQRHFWSNMFVIIPQLFADDNRVCCCSRFMNLCPCNTCIVFRNVTEDTGHK